MVVCQYKRLLWFNNNNNYIQNKSNLGNTRFNRKCLFDPFYNKYELILIEESNRAMSTIIPNDFKLLVFASFNFHFCNSLKFN